MAKKVTLDDIKFYATLTEPKIVEKGDLAKVVGRSKEDKDYINGMIQQYNKQQTEKKSKV